MPLQMSLLSESLVAKTAPERPDVLVHSHVYHQVVGLGEGLAAHLAILEDPVTRLVVANGFVDVGQVVGLNLVKASVIVTDFGHHRR